MNQVLRVFAPLCVPTLAARPAETSSAVPQGVFATVEHAPGMEPSIMSCETS